MGFSLAAFGLGALVSLSTSWVLVSRLERLGERLAFSEALLGLVAALAADTPEITSAITALSHHERAVGAGVVLGSNVFNLAALLGLSAVVAGRIRLHRRVLLLDGAVGLGVAVMAVVAVAGAGSPAVALVVCAAVLVPYAVVLSGHGNLLRRLMIPGPWIGWLARAVAEEETDLVQAIRPRRGTWRDAVVAVVSLVTVISASVAMERAASSLGRRWAVPGIVVGGLVLAGVTSLPNAVAGFYLASRGRGAALLSTALNSNTLNVVVGLLLPGVVTGLAAPSATGTLVVSSYLGLTALALAFAWTRAALTRVEGSLIIGGYLAFVAVLVAMAG